MLRFLGGSLIIGGMLGLGIWHRNQLSLRIEIIKDLIRILEMLKSEIDYSLSPLPECCLRVSRRMDIGSPLEKSLSAALNNTYRKMESDCGTHFKTILEGEMKAALSAYPTGRKELRLFLDFAEKEGFQDKDMQVRLIEISIREMKDQYDLWRGHLQDWGRLSVGLGILGGILLVILLV